MIFEKTEIYNFDNAIRGMRNPLNSWHRMDSKLYTYSLSPVGDNDKLQEHNVLQVFNNVAVCFKLGPNDLKLAKSLIKGGTEHRKFLRQIIVSVDITAPRYFWQEFDTYKVGTVANSCSTIHKIHDRVLTKEDFVFITDSILQDINNYIIKYQKTKTSTDLTKLKSLLPEGFLQKRTITLNYENVLTMYNQRKNHRLAEWNTSFKNWALSLPYIKEFATEGGQSI